MVASLRIFGPQFLIDHLKLDLVSIYELFNRVLTHMQSGVFHTFATDVVIAMDFCCHFVTDLNGQERKSV
jgi:hypothetical protein